MVFMILNYSSVTIEHSSKYINDHTIWKANKAFQASSSSRESRNREAGPISPTEERKGKENAGIGIHSSNDAQPSYSRCGSGAHRLRHCIPFG